MPYNDPDPDDPHVLVGVELAADRESIREMAYAFAEEFATLGFDEARLLALFRSPFYAGAHRALRILGEEEILGIVRESTQIWGRFRVSIRDAAPAPDSTRGSEEGSCRT
jgi:hypothetical protein